MNSNFLGREEELKSLEIIKSKKTSSLIAVTGRRRIGKSTLVEVFSKSFKSYVNFQGLPPREGQTNQDQLDNFAKQFSLRFNLPITTFSDWSEAFYYLSEQTKSGEWLIFLDELSWLGRYDKDFSGKLKIAWDTLFHRNNKLVLAICGSVSSWIEKNILNKTDFVGRISLVIRLQELDLKACNKFWGERTNKISSFEKFKLLSILGGIPKYLEEINPKATTDENIDRLCFKSGGYLFEDFDRIFNDIFESRSSLYKTIITSMLSRKLSASEIAQECSLNVNSDLTEYLKDLNLSGFIDRDWTYKADGKRSKISVYRIKDCYLRFYLKYIEPNKDKIQKNIYRSTNLETLKNWESIMGLQFESLVLSRLNEIIPLLKIDQHKIISASPHVQRKTSRTNPCQIDLLIHLKNDTYYLGEIKFRKKISKDVIKEVEEKRKSLKVPKNCTIRPILIYAGELDDRIKDEDYFDHIINMEELL
ncbi:MAG TPA: ATP-binding protein [Oligoflexia bacterium]|nr:ATP-binding protein [Oligoflexia bacterium]HMP48201.1 ATP-binding protein [Oligoflexia bacterium]